MTHLEHVYRQTARAIDRLRQLLRVATFTITNTKRRIGEMDRLLTRGQNRGWPGSAGNR